MSRKEEKMKLSIRKNIQVFRHLHQMESKNFDTCLENNGKRAGF